MQPRYVIVPALPKDKNQSQRGAIPHSVPNYDGFDIYDNVEKHRMEFNFESRAAAEPQCTKLNNRDATTCPILRTREA